MSATTKNLRFWDNNFITQEAIDVGRMTFSSETSGFEFSNSFNAFRSKSWRPEGNFDIDSTNKKIYFDDGGLVTATLTEGSYTGTTLATEIQTQLNISGSGWGCTYTNHAFRITASPSQILNYSITTNAIWETIGHNFLFDRSETLFIEKNIVRHTSEWFELDAGIAVPLTGFAAIGEIDKQFGLSNLAEIKIQANNVPVWTAPPLEFTIEREDKGVYLFMDSVENSYRYWRVTFVDKTNPQTIELGHIYLGDHTTTANTNIGAGLTKTLVDPTKAQESEKGARFFNKKAKYHKISGNTYDVLFEDDRLLLEKLYNEKGLSEPFFISLDPTASVSPDLKEFTYFVRFDGNPAFKNLFRDKWTVSLNFREVVS